VGFGLNASHAGSISSIEHVPRAFDRKAGEVLELSAEVTVLHRFGIRLVAADGSIDIDPEPTEGRMFLSNLIFLLKAGKDMIARNVREGMARAQGEGGELRTSAAPFSDHARVEPEETRLYYPSHRREHPVPSLNGVVITTALGGVGYRRFASIKPASHHHGDDAQGGSARFIHSGGNATHG